MESFIFDYLAKILRMKQFKFEKQFIEMKKLPANQLEDNGDLKPLHERLTSIEATLNGLCHEQNQKKRDEHLETKFKYAALIIDRFFFYLSLVYFLLTFVSFVW